MKSKIRKLSQWFLQEIIHKKTVEACWCLGCNFAIPVLDIVRLQPYVLFCSDISESFVRVVRNIINQFMDDYPNIEIEIIHNNNERIKVE